MAQSTVVPDFTRADLVNIAHSSVYVQNLGDMPLARSLGPQHGEALVSVAFSHQTLFRRAACLDTLLPVLSDSSQHGAGRENGPSRLARTGKPCLSAIEGSALGQRRGQLSAFTEHRITPGSRTSLSAPSVPGCQRRAPSQT